MFDTTGYALMTVAVATALFHTLIPDHWLPFVLIGNARGWRGGTTAVISGVSALIHVALSIVLGILALSIGEVAASAVGETLERSGAVLLVVFGVGYALWSWRKGGHFHPGGAKFHLEADDAHCDGHEGECGCDRSARATCHTADTVAARATVSEAGSRKEISTTPLIRSPYGTW